MKYIHILLLFFSVIATTYAQPNPALDFRSYFSIYFNEITIDNEIIGYLHVMKEQKENEMANNHYLKIEVMDENLNELVEIEYLNHIGYHLMGFSFNGDLFLLKFIKPSKEKIKYVAFNGAGELVFDKLSNMTASEIAIYEIKSNGFYGYYEYPFTASISPISGFGFLDYPLSYEVVPGEKNKITLIKNNGAVEKYECDHDPDSKVKELSYIGHNSEITFSISKKKDEQKSSLVVFGTNYRTGNPEFEIEIIDEEYSLRAFQQLHDKTNKHLIIFSELYSKHKVDETLPKRLQGASIITRGVQLLKIDETGKIITKDNFLFEKDLEGIIKINEDQKWDSVGYINIQQVIANDKGYSILLTDKYKKTDITSKKFNAIVLLNLDKEFKYLSSKKIFLNPPTNKRDKRIQYASTGNRNGKLHLKFEQHFQKDNLYYIFFSRNYDYFGMLKDVGIVKVENGTISSDYVNLRTDDIRFFDTKMTAEENSIKIHKGKKGYFITQYYKSAGKNDWRYIFNFEKINF